MKLKREISQTYLIPKLIVANGNSYTHADPFDITSSVFSVLSLNVTAPIVVHMIRTFTVDCKTYVVIYNIPN